jgi:hypothetical protein
MNAPVNVCRIEFLIAVIYEFWLSITQSKVRMTQNACTVPAQVPAETLAYKIRRA